MRTIRQLINSKKKVYIFLKNKAIQARFMSNAEHEGITFGDMVKPTERQADDIMALNADGTICFLGWAGRMCYHYGGDAAIRINYEKYIDGADDYRVNLKK